MFPDIGIKMATYVHVHIMRTYIKINKLFFFTSDDTEKKIVYLEMQLNFQTDCKFHDP